VTSALASQIPGYTVGTWKIDQAHSDVSFTVRHLMVSKVRGHFRSFEGTFVTAEDPQNSSVTATIQLDSIDTNQEQRDAHLRSADFLEIEKHPAMTYRSTGVRRDGDEIIVDGDLTIRGITHPVALTVEVNGFGPDPYGGTRTGFSAAGEINRNDYGITANMVLPTGGVMVSEKIQLTIEIEATLATP